MHPTELQPVALLYGGKTFYVMPDLDFILEIEDELGSLPDLYCRFRGNDWRAAEAITIVQMMLARAGKNVDWKELGQKILSEGVMRYKNSVLNLLCLPVTGKALFAA